MKKSQCLKLAQLAVLADSSLLPETKLDVLKVLMDEEYVQKLCEQSTEESKKESEVDPY